MSTPDLHLRFRQLAVVLFASGSLGLAAAQAASSGNMSAAEKHYQQDRARCQSGLSNEARATCLREAGAALETARRSKPAERTSPNYEQNALARCTVLPPADRPSCEAMMREGSTRGSVEGGGIYREYREIVPATPGVER